MTLGHAVVALAISAALLLPLQAPVSAHPVGTAVIAAGQAGAYEYEIAVGAYSPVRRQLLVSVQVTAGGSPVIEADVSVSSRLTQAQVSSGPFAASNAPDHPFTYEAELQFDEGATGEVWLSVDVASRHGSANMQARVILPGDARSAEGGTSLSQPRAAAYPEGSGGEQHVQSSSGTGSGGSAVVWAASAGFIAVLVAVAGLVVYRRRA